jgi:hypothetical protein
MNAITETAAAVLRAATLAALAELFVEWYIILTHFRGFCSFDCFAT